jgi:hypothetical protein
MKKTMEDKILSRVAGLLSVRKSRVEITNVDGDADRGTVHCSVHGAGRYKVEFQDRYNSVVYCVV